MVIKTLSAPTQTQTFPAGTTDPGFTYTVTGLLADGTTPFNQTNSSGSFDLDPGTYVGTVSKLGFTSAPSAPLTISIPTPVTLDVPDPTQAAVFS
jgi:hypothetical protein